MTTGMRTPLYKSFTQIQETDALAPNGFWRINHTRPIRHWGAVQCNPEADLRKICLLVKEGPAPTFQTMVANGQLETTKSIVELKFEAGDIDFQEVVIVMEN